MRNKLLNETPFSTVDQARSILARWVDDYNTGIIRCRARTKTGGVNPARCVTCALRDNTYRSPVAAG